MGYPIRKTSVEEAHAKKHAFSPVRCYKLSQKEMQNIERLYPTDIMKRPITTDLSYYEIKLSYGFIKVREGLGQGMNEQEISEHYGMKLRVVRRILTILSRQEVPLASNKI